MKLTLKYFFILLSVFIIRNSTAQNFPFEAKLMVRLPGTNATDTVWFGCDTNATNNYDDSLDVLQTTFDDSISILAHDSSAEAMFGTGSCGNLKRIIKPFAGDVYFDFYIKVDSAIKVVSLEPYPQIFWDTTDFLYNGKIFKNDSFSITGVILDDYSGGYLDATDNLLPVFIYSISHNGKCENLDSSFSSTTQTEVILEQTPWKCATNDYVFYFRLYSFFNSECTPLQIVEEEIMNNNIYPNPTSNYIVIGKGLYDVKVYSLQGIKQPFIKKGDKIDVSDLKPGIYILKIDNHITKFIKL